MLEAGFKTSTPSTDPGAGGSGGSGGGGGPRGSGGVSGVPDSAGSSGCAVRPSGEGSTQLWAMITLMVALVSRRRRRDLSRG